MSATNAVNTQTFQRTAVDPSQDLRELRRRDNLIRDSFVNIVSGFERRPDPVSPWNRAADRTQMPGGRMIGAIRSAILAARDRNPELAYQTVEAACAFCDALKADFTSLIPSDEACSVIALALLETECAVTAKVEEMRLVASPTPIEAERAIRPLLKEESALVRLISGIQRLARQPQMRMAR